MTIKAYKKSDGKVVLEIKEQPNRMFIPDTCEIDFKHVVWVNKKEQEEDILVEAE